MVEVWTENSEKMVMPLHEGRYRSDGVAGTGGNTSKRSAEDRAFKAKSNRNVDSGGRGNRRHAQIFAVDNGFDGEAMRRREMEAEASPEVDSDLLTRTSWTDASVALNEIRKVSYNNSLFSSYYPDRRFNL